MEMTEPMNKVLQNLLSEVAEYYVESKRKENERWERGESFNIFNTIGLRSEEVRLHSAFIGELLNPRGSHGASSLFLKAFLEVMGIEDGYLDYEDCSPNILERVIGTVTATEGGYSHFINSARVRLSRSPRCACFSCRCFSAVP